MDRSIADDAPFSDFVPAGLELRLDQYDTESRGGENRNQRGKDQLQGDEGQIGHRGTDGFSENRWRKTPGVDPLVHDDAGIRSQPGMELTVSHIHRMDARGAALQQNIGETAGGGSQIAADEASRREREVVQGPFQLEAAAGHVPERLAGSQPDRQRRVEKLARLLHPVISGDDLAGQDERLGLAARFRQTQLLDEQVGPDLHCCEAAGGPAGPMTAWMRASSRSMSIGFEK